MNIHPMWNTYPTLSKELTTTLRLMEQAVQIDNQEIQAAVSLPTVVLLFW